MKKWGIICGILTFLLLGCGRNSEDITAVIEGVVLKVSQNTVLISQKDDLTEADFKKSQEEILLDSSYDLIWVSGIEETLKPQTKVKITLEGTILETYPPQATAQKVEVLGELEFGKDDSATIYNEELLTIFPQTIRLNQRYNGYAEYGHIQTLTQINDNTNEVELVFEGEMRDGYGEYDSRTFELVYLINEDSVVEKIQNQDPYSRLQQSNLLVSIIPDKVILKYPLEVGNSWIESFSYEGQTYSAKTSIVRAEKNSDELLEIETLTLVEGIEGFYQEVYKESRVFVQGRGMTSFSNLFSMGSVNVEHESTVPSEDLYMFGFGLSEQSVN